MIQSFTPRCHPMERHIQHTSMFDIHTHRVHPLSGFSIVNIPLSQIDHLPPADAHTAYSVGIHPWATADESLCIDSVMQQIALTARSSSVLAIGETGMDRVRGGQMEVQESVFRRHVTLSEDVGKMLIIHCVKAIDDILRIHREMRPSQRWIVHGFRGKPHQAMQLLDRGIDLSFGLHYNEDSLLCAYRAGRWWIETDDAVDHDISDVYDKVSCTIRKGFDTW